MTFKLSQDPAFVPTLFNLVRAYVRTVYNSILLWVDETSQTQALDPTQHGPHIKRERSGTWTQDFLRDTAAKPFAARNMASGKVGGTGFWWHRHGEFFCFLRSVDQEHDPEFELHLGLENYGAHGTDELRRWFRRHPPVKIHFITTKSSLMNTAECWFAELTGKGVCRGSFASVPGLIATIAAFIGRWNRNPKLFVWRPRSEDILEKRERARRGNKQIIRPPASFVAVTKSHPLTV